MEPTITTLGAMLGLAIAIGLIIFKVTPAYSMMIGAVVGGIVGGVGLSGTLDVMITGAQGVVPVIIRIVTAGILVGVLIDSGAANKIADTIVNTFGEKRAILSLALAVGILTAVGVFGDVAVITVAPIALALGKKLGYSNLVLLTALMGGEKAGMVISPNPQAIVIADLFEVPLATLMYSNIIPGVIGIIMTVLVCKHLDNKFNETTKIEPDLTEKNLESTSDEEDKYIPSIWVALSGPIVAVVLLLVGPIFGVNIDPIFALPIGGFVGTILMGQTKHILDYMTSGLGKMMPVAVLLLGTGTIAGIIQSSYFQQDMTNLLIALNIPDSLLGAISGTIMGGATASASAGATIAASTFSGQITQVISPLAGAGTMHAGTIVLDSLPHGSIFHTSAGVMNLSVKDRLKALPYEILIGFIIMISSVIFYLLFT